MSEDTPKQPADPDDSTESKNIGDDDQVSPSGPPPEPHSTASSSKKARLKGRSSQDGEAEGHKGKGGSREKKVIRPNVPMPTAKLQRIASELRWSSMRSASVKDMIATAFEEASVEDIVYLIRKVWNQGRPPAMEEPGN